MSLWTAIKNLFGKKSTPAKSSPKPVSSSPPPSSGRRQKWIPFAHIPRERMKTRGRYPKGGPQGAVVHFTAGRYEGGLQKAIDTVMGGIKSGFAYLCVGYDGSTVQAHPIDEYGYHAGESAWNVKLKGLTFKLIGAVSDDLIGIEINNAGKLEKTSDGRYKTWFGTYVPADQVRYVTEAQYGCPTGYYQKYSKNQEETLVRILFWLKDNDPDVFDFDYVLGHHEVAGKLGIGRWRKNDPGGALSMPMDVFREYLKTEYTKRKVQNGIAREESI